MKEPNYRVVILNQRLHDAVKVFQEELEKDEELYYGWQSNIAMAFYDEFKRFSQTYGRNEAVQMIHEVANNSAKNFLDQLIKTNQA